jgi:predicted GH43/DUF377 family glycosyl hydrolase
MCDHDPPDLPPPGEPYSLAYCRLCYLFHNDARYNLLWGGDGLRAAAKNARCRHFGAEVGREKCPSCAGHVEVKTFACAVHGKCTPLKPLADVACCQGCTEFTAAPPFQTRSVRFDEKTLAPHLLGWRFNGGLLPWREGYLLAWRHSTSGSEVYVSTLDKDFTPTGEHRRLDLVHERCAGGREDPRLFTFRGKLHVCFTGALLTDLGGGRKTVASILVATLDDDLRVRSVVRPNYAGMDDSWEKNWGFFEYADTLYAVYTPRPHTVLRFGDDWQGETAYETPGVPWNGGEMRGGAPPYRVGEEYYCFFHDYTFPPQGRRRYRTGLYTFQAKPPFRPLRYIPEPILEGDPATNTHGHYDDSVYPCGAVVDGDDWVVSVGVHDRWTELHHFNRRELEAGLRPVK